MKVPRDSKEELRKKMPPVLSAGQAVRQGLGKCEDCSGRGKLLMGISEFMREVYQECETCKGTGKA
jgi:DnaJ-class molecular chaperone